MILEEETFIKYGYYPRNLKSHSGKKILAICDNCEKIRETSKNSYRDLCRSCGLQGKRLSKTAKEKISNARKGKFRGENSPAWKGGISFEPYCIKFNNEFKERVREFWNRKCVLCEKDEIMNGRKLDVHHVSYNKDTCCDESIPLFVVLCRTCHSQTNSNRDYWNKHFTELIFKKDKNGKCFYNKEENEECSKL